MNSSELTTLNVSPCYSSCRLAWEVEMTASRFVDSASLGRYRLDRNVARSFDAKLIFRCRIDPAWNRKTCRAPSPYRYQSIIAHFDGMAHCHGVVCR